MSIKVTKFGGTSLATTENILKAKAIVQSDKTRRFIVVSAPGKIIGMKSSKVTDLLIDAYTEMCLNQKTSISSSLGKVIEKFETLASELNVDIDAELERTLDEIEINKCNRDFVISRGEYLMGILFARILGYRFVDATKLIVLNKNGRVNEEKTRLRFQKFFQNTSLSEGIVMGGFYGCEVDGKIKLMERGGGDYSGAIAATCTNACLYEIFTDTNGVQTANPAIVQNTKTISRIDFSKLYKLAKGGASVIFPDCLPLLSKHSIPLVIDNTLDPHVNFTVVSDKKLCPPFTDKWFSLTYKTHSNINKNTTEVLCICNKLKISHEEIKKLLSAYEAHILQFKATEFTILIDTILTEVIIKKLHDFMSHSF